MEIIHNSLHLTWKKLRRERSTVKEPAAVTNSGKTSFTVECGSDAQSKKIQSEYDLEYRMQSKSSSLI